MGNWCVFWFIIEWFQLCIYGYPTMSQKPTSHIVHKVLARKKKHISHNTLKTVITPVWNPAFWEQKSVFIRATSTNSQQLTFLAIIRPEGRWETLNTTPPLPAPSSQIFSKSSSFSSPTFCFCVRKASRRFRCCSSNSNSSSFFCNASKFVLAKSRINKERKRWVIHVLLMYSPLNKSFLSPFRQNFCRCSFSEVLSVSSGDIKESRSTVATVLYHWNLRKQRFVCFFLLLHLPFGNNGDQPSSQQTASEGVSVFLPRCRALMAWHHSPGTVVVMAMHFLEKSIVEGTWPLLLCTNWNTKPVYAFIKNCYVISAD